MARSTYWRREFPSPLHLLQNEFSRILGEYLEPRQAGADKDPAEADRASRQPGG